jgi:glycosyltransferase involved in cell wall biosynthesis
VAITDCVRDDLVRRGIDPSKITVIDNCLETFPELSDEEGEFILNLGRMVKTKGLDYLIEAMRQVDYKLVMCGKGPESKKIEKLVRKYGLQDRVDMRGWVSEEEKLRLMSTCKFFVMPSIYEAYGLAALEALSYGKPIVCTDVDGLPGNVKDAGYYVKPKDPEGLAKGINEMLTDDSLRKQLSENAIKVSRAFTWDDQIAKTEKLYRAIVDGTLGQSTE